MKTGRKKDEEGKKPKVMIANGIKLSYNELSNVKGLVAAIEGVIDNAVTNLQMLDLSHNQLTTIDPEICQFTQLRVLYLHGNLITNINEVKKLSKLPNLKILTLHGNCLIIEKPGTYKTKNTTTNKSTLHSSRQSRRGFEVL